MSQPMNAYEKEKSELSKQTKAVLTIGALGCFIICGTCFGASSFSNDSDTFATKNNGFLSSTSENFLDDDEDDYRIKQLKEHNAKQAAKIRLLKQELIEKTQNIYEVKSQLFKQLGDPRDKEKIGELNEALSQKEKHIELLRNEIQQRESLVGKMQKEIIEVEKSKDQELIALRNEIDHLKDSSKNFYHDYEKKSRVLEATQLHLTEALENKSRIIESLEHELSAHQSTLASKNEELQQALQNFAEKEEESKRLVLELMTAIEDADHLEETLKGLALDIGLLEDALVASRELLESKTKELASIEESKSQEIARIEESSFQEKLRFEEVVAQKAKLAEELILEKQNNLVLNNEFNQSQIVSERRLEEEKDTHKALTAALLEQQRLAIELDEALEEKVANVEQLKNDIVEMQETIDKHLLALEQSQEIKKELEEAYKIILDKNSVLDGYEKEILAFQDKIEEEANRRRTIEQALKDKEAQGIELAEAMLTLIHDAENDQNNVKEMKAVLAENALAIDEFKNRVALLEKELKDEMEKNKISASILDEKQVHILALDETIKAQTIGAEIHVKLLEDDIAKLQNTIDQHVIALNESQKIKKDLEEAHKIILENYSALNAYEEEILTLHDKIEGEASLRRATEQALKEKAAEGIELAEAMLVLIHDAESYQNNAEEMKKVLAENTSTIDEFKNRVTLLERELKVEGEKNRVSVLVLEEKQIHILALDETIKAQAADGEAHVKRLENDIEKMQKTIDEHVVALNESQKFKKELEDAYKTILDKNLALNAYEEEILVLQDKIEAEASQRRVTEQALKDKEAKGIELAETMLVLIHDVDSYQNNAEEMKKVLASNTLTIDEFKNRVELLEKELKDEGEKNRVSASLLEERQIHILALDETIKSQALDADVHVKRLENDVAKMQKTIDKHVIALNESQKFKKELEEAHKIILDSYTVINSYEEEVLAFQNKVEEEVARRRTVEQALSDKEAQGVELAEAMLVLIHDVEGYKTDAFEAKKMMTTNALAMDEMNQRMALLEKELKEEREKNSIIALALTEKQRHVLALDEVINAQAVDAERLESALVESKELIDQHYKVLQESKNIERELEKAQLALSRHQDFLMEQQQVIDSYELRRRR